MVELVGSATSGGTGGGGTGWGTRPGGGVSARRRGCDSRDCTLSSAGYRRGGYAGSASGTFAGAG